MKDIDDDPVIEVKQPSFVHIKAELPKVPESTVLPQKTDALRQGISQLRKD